MQPRTVLIALDTNKNDPNFKKLQSLTAEQQIKNIETSIRKVCAELSQKEPNALWIVNWREYGISDAGSRFLSNEAKALLKTTMQNLTKKFKNLAIVSGTVATKKYFDKFKYKEKLADVKKSYEETQWLQTEEKKQEDEQITLHLEKVEKLAEDKSEEGIDVVRSSCYVFQGGEIQRHDKTAPYLETLMHEDDDQKEDAMNRIVFEPGRSKKRNHLIPLIHPATGKALKIGVEICREHRFGALQREAAKEKPYIHLVISDSVDLFLDKIHGSYVMHIDSYAKPKLILTKEVSTSSQVQFYQMNLLDDEPKLRGPLQPLYPFEFQMLDLINAKLAEFSDDKSKKYQVLDQMRAKIQRNFALTEASTYYDSLLDILENNQELLNAPRSVLEGIGSYFFRNPEPDTSILTKQLQHILLQQREHHLNCKDYLTQKEAPEIATLELERKGMSKR